MAKSLVEEQPGVVVDLVMVKEGIKKGAEINRHADKDLEVLITNLGLIYKHKNGKYLVAKVKSDLEALAEDTKARGDWFGIPQCCVKAFLEQGSKLSEKISKEEIKALQSGKHIPNEFFLGSYGYIPCSLNCKFTLERGIKTKVALDRIDPRLWGRFKDVHLRRRLVEFGGEVCWWKK